MVEVSGCDNEGFEPFYSSKVEGRGLTIGHAMIEAWGGRLWAARMAKGGRDFPFTLPVVR